MFSASRVWVLVRLDTAKSKMFHIRKKSSGGLWKSCGMNAMPDCEKRYGQIYVWGMPFRSKTDVCLSRKAHKVPLPTARIDSAFCGR